MLALIGQAADPVCTVLHAYADRVGVPAVTITDPASWTVTVELPGTARLVGPAGERVSCAVNRGLPMVAGLSQAESSDLLAAWWAGLALLPGRVVNRPDQTGFVPTPDPQASVLITAGWLAELALPAPAVNLHDVASGNFRYRLGQPAAEPASAVLAATAFDPDRTWRFLLAGDAALELSRPAAETEQQRTQLTELVRQAQLAGHAHLLLVLAWCQDQVMVVAANPMPGLTHYAAHQDQVHAALLDWLRP